MPCEPSHHVTFMIDEVGELEAIANELYVRMADPMVEEHCSVVAVIGRIEDHCSNLI